MTLYGQSSGDFRETSSRIELFHVVTRNALGILTPDAFTQITPPVVAATHTSTTLTGITKRGVLGGTVAFTRPEVGNNCHGGPVLVGGFYNANLRPLGIFLNDSLGNAFENTPGVASNRGPFVSGTGSCVGVRVWETKNQIANDLDVTAYAAGQKLYASVNGLLTNNIVDAYEYNVVGQADPDFVTVVGVVRRAPDANFPILVLDLRV